MTLLLAFCPYENIVIFICRRFKSLKIKKAAFYSYKMQRYINLMICQYVVFKISLQTKKPLNIVVFCFTAILSCKDGGARACQFEFVWFSILGLWGVRIDNCDK